MTHPTGIQPLRRALLSVYDKRNLAAFARALHAAGAELVASGGTAQALGQAGLPCVEVGALTGFGEHFGGRVKTLHPAVHAALLARPSQEPELAAMGLAPFDLVAIDLYPFEAAWEAGRRGLDLIEMIDVGGPAMLRAGAKNHERVAALASPDDYEAVTDELVRLGGTSAALRRRLGQRAFARVAAYDAAIAAALAAEDRGDARVADDLPGYEPPRVLRYGENPHQAAAVLAPLRRPAGAATTSLVQLSGEPLSYTNWLDLDAALRLVIDLPAPCAAVLKHAGPCGAATGASLAEALDGAIAGDPLSAYGGACALGERLELEHARALTAPGRWFEIVLAPSFSAEAVELITSGPRWGQRVRLLACDGEAVRFPPMAPWRERRGLCGGGLLVQDPDAGARLDLAAESATVAVPAALRTDLDLAWRLVAHVKSNAIVLVRGGQLVGVGGGQPSRVDAVELAVRKAGERARGAVLASDAFFPFADGLAAAIRAGIAGAVQPGGSRRDDEVAAAARQAGIPLLMTGERHFRH